MCLFDEEEKMKFCTSYRHIRNSSLYTHTHKKTTKQEKKSSKKLRGERSSLQPHIFQILKIEDTLSMLTQHHVFVFLFIFFLLNDGETNASKSEDTEDQMKSGV